MNVMILNDEENPYRGCFDKVNKSYPQGIPKGYHILREAGAEEGFSEGAKAQLKKVTDELDIEFILCLLEQNENILWSKKGRHSCKEQIRKLKALVKEASC